MKDGDCDGKPRMWIDWQKLENPALRAKLKLPDTTTGVMVRASHRPTKDHPRQRRDVITKAGDHVIDNDRMAHLADKDLRMSFTYLAPQLAKNGKAPRTVIRDGVEWCIEAPVSAQADFLVPSLRGKQPSYFIWGPLALAPAMEELVDSLARVLTPHETSHGYSTPVGQVVSHVNALALAVQQHSPDVGFAPASPPRVTQVSHDVVQEPRQILPQLR